MPKLFEHFDYHNKALNNLNVFVAGIECEIESVRDVSKEVTADFVIEHDGSLRNNGKEFISIPMEKDSLLTAFKNLHAKIVYFDKTDAFSPRTSTHVHVNVRPFEAPSLRNLLLFYALYEEFFFSMVDSVRRDNIHCVPLTETHMPTLYKQDWMIQSKRWHKYTAFNMLPIQKQGTVEFRHLQGTEDADLLNRWLSTLNNLWSLAQTEGVTKDTIMDTDLHKHWFRTIFADAPEVLMLEPAMPNLIRNTLIDVKMAFV